MATRTPPLSKSDDFTYRQLIEKVVAGDDLAWQEFIERFSKLIFSLVWRYAKGNIDLCNDLYLATVEGLHQTNESGETFYRLRRYLQTIDNYGGNGRLTTWLGRVTQNLVSDHFRKQTGRRTLPRAISRKDLDHQKVFKLLYWDLLTEREAFGTMKNKYPKLSRNAFDCMVAQINISLKESNRWSLYSEVIRRTPALPINPCPQSDSKRLPAVQLPDPGSEPEKQTLTKEQRSKARDMGHTLRKVIADLEPTNRMLLVFKFKHGMTANQIENTLPQVKDSNIYLKLEQTKQRLKESLENAGFKWGEVVLGLQEVEGLLDEFEEASIA